jgi:hypothetical protein
VYPESVLWNISGVGHVSFGRLDAFTVKQVVSFLLKEIN